MIRELVVERNFTRVGENELTIDLGRTWNGVELLRRWFS